MAEKIFENYTLDDYKTFFGVASSVIIQNLSATTQKLSAADQKSIDENLILIRKALKECQSKFGFQLEGKKHFPDGSLGDVFEQVVLLCARLKIQPKCQFRRVSDKPQSLKIQLKAEQLRQNRKKYFKTGIRRALTVLTQRTKKEK